MTDTEGVGRDALSAKCNARGMTVAPLLGVTRALVVVCRLGVQSTR